MSKKKTILIIEDEPHQVELLSYNFKTEGINVIVAADGEDGVLKAVEYKPDLILLDWMLPKLSGIEVCRQIRKNHTIKEIPIIILTARSEESDKVRGLEIGADDFVTKPYSVSELIARVKAAMRRPKLTYNNDEINYDIITVDINQHLVLIDGAKIELGPKEYRLLICLLEKPGRVFSRDNLLDMVWGVSADIDTRTVDVHVGRLRKAISAVSGKKLIRTVRSFGYSLATSDVV